MINNFLVSRSKVYNRQTWFYKFSRNKDLRTQYWVNSFNVLLEKLKLDPQMEPLIPDRKIKYLDDLQYFSSIDKSLIKNSIDVNKYKSKLMSTGGSSGEVFKFPADHKWSEVCRANNQYARRSFIYNNNKIAFIWGHSHLFGDKNALITLYIRRLKDALNRTKRFNAYKTSKNDLTNLIHGIIKLKPNHIIGYASSIYLLYKHAKEYGYLLKFDTVTVTSEYLSTKQAEEISVYFNAIVRQEYGSAEFGVMAFKPTADSQ